MSQHTSGKLEARITDDERHHCHALMSVDLNEKMDKEIKAAHPLIAHILFGRGHVDAETAAANAERLARAWNLLDSYDEMREALGACLRFIGDLDGTSPSDTDDVIKARAILKKTGEGK